MMTSPEIDAYGNKLWKNEKGECHRENGPALIYPNGEKSWWRNGEYHRLDGPAITYLDGSKFWYKNGKRHRENGPAIMYPSGREFWYINGKYIDINPILERFEISPDWRNWTDAEKMIVRLAL